MGKVIQFPNVKDLQTNEKLRGLKLELHYCEQNLKDALEQLDFLNDSILQLSTEYDELMDKIVKLQGETDEKV